MDNKKEKKVLVQNLTGGEIEDVDGNVVLEAGEIKKVSKNEAKELKAQYPNFIGDAEEVKVKKK
ncbi:hypothetical protein CL633_04550 [bacterium]|jgi:hypothetical protein|nr:hypothetical protein [bacterium]|tara:strand:+ start:7066 stop:7257 length:192 start_codon:yes stop_codon:yes gene_type:complete